MLCCSWWGVHPTRRSCACRRTLLLLQLTAGWCGFEPLSGVQERFFIELFSGNSAMQVLQRSTELLELRLHSEQNKLAVLSNIMSRRVTPGVLCTADGSALQTGTVCSVASVGRTLWYWSSDRDNHVLLTWDPQRHHFAERPIATHRSAWCEMGAASWEVSCPFMAFFFNCNKKAFTFSIKKGVNSCTS